MAVHQYGETQQLGTEPIERVHDYHLLLGEKVQGKRIIDAVLAVGRDLGFNVRHKRVNTATTRYDHQGERITTLRYDHSAVRVWLEDLMEVWLTGEPTLEFLVSPIDEHGEQDTVKIHSPKGDSPIEIGYIDRVYKLLAKKEEPGKQRP